MENLTFAINAVLPIILLIGLGYFLSRINFFNDGFLKNANKFCFRVALPVLLFKNVYDADFSQINWSLILFASIGIITIFFLGLISVLIFTKDNSKRGVLLQCTFRSNFAIIGISLAASLFADGSLLNSQAQLSAALVSGFSIPIFNILAVISLSIFKKDEENKPSAKKILKGIATNPLIIGILCGFVFMGIRELIPTHDVLTWKVDSLGNVTSSTSTLPIWTMKKNLPFLYKCITNLSVIASPLALIVLGGQFKFSAVKSLAKYIVFGTVFRVIIAPILAITFAVLMKFNEPEIATIIALFGSPVAVSSAIMANEMGGDGELAGQLVVWTTIVSSFTIFLLILILKSMNLL